MEGKVLRQYTRAAQGFIKPARSLAVIAASTLLGFLVTIQIQSALNRPPASQDYSRGLSTATIQRLEAEQKALKDTVAQLRAQVFARQQAAGSGPGSLGGLSQELERQRMAAGLTAARGPGIMVTLDDSGRPVPAGEDAANFLVHDYELRDVTNLLWLAGAEAVAINGERVVGTTSIYCVGSTIIVNDTRLSPPYELRAIGNAGHLESTLQDPGTLKKLKSRVKLYGVQLKVAQSRDLELAPYSGRLDVKYANPSGM